MVMALSIYGSYHTQCPSFLLCTGSSQTLPAQSFIAIYLIGSAVCISLLIWHLIRLPSIKSRLISIAANLAFGFGAFVLYALLFITLGHWHA